MPDTTLLRERGSTPDGGRHQIRSTRTSKMYIIILAIWTAVSAATVKALWPVVLSGFRRDTTVGVVCVFTLLFILYFFLNGTKDVIYPFAYRLTPWRRQLPPVRGSTDMPRVALLYVTCNDFSEESLTASICQDYWNYEVVILDDSSKPEYIEEVTRYAEARRIPVVRRPDRKGFKAGNLNNFLRRAGHHYDFFVIVDSDEILPAYFINRALDYFAADPGTGIVQANHIATRNRTPFMRMFAPGVDSHFPAYQLVKAHAGFLSLLGHGAMVSMACYQAAGGFPEIVAEDIGFAIDALAKGRYRCDFAADITCAEEFPPDFLAFKKRHRRWTEGNMEFMRKYTRTIFFGRGLAWYDRLDIVLFAYGLPLAAVFSLYVLVNAVLFPLIGFRFHYPLWMLVPTVVCLFAPMLNDMMAWRKAPKRKLLAYLLHSSMLFGSMFFVSCFASIRSAFKGSVFHVTPKKANRVGLKQAFRANLPQIGAAAVLVTVVSVIAGSALPVILLVIPVIFMPYMTVMNAAGTKDSDNGTHILDGKEH